jgi:3-oxoacyl-[acyl-carrier-protein] synthase-3
MGIAAAKVAIERSGIAKEDIDFIVFATISPDYYFRTGVALQKELGLPTIGALDIRNQCSGFVYALSIADQSSKPGCTRIS